MEIKYYPPKSRLSDRGQQQFIADLRKAKATRGLSWEQIGRRCRVSIRALQTWSAGQRRPTPLLARLIVDALNRNDYSAFEPKYEEELCTQSSEQS